jgi:hypothetical protein
MINIGLPPPLLARLRLHWQNTRDHVQRQKESLRETYFRTQASTVEWIRNVSAKGVALITFRRRTLTRHLRQLDAFEQVYDRMVDLVCWTAKEDVSPERAERYAKLRSEMKKAYRIVRARLRPHWHTPNAEHDPFAALYLPDDITEFIHSPVGIECLMQTRQAVDAYRSTLTSRLN